MQDIYSKRKKKTWAHNSAHLVAQKSVVIAEREERVVFFIFGRFSDSHDEQENNNFLLIYHKFYLYMYF